MVRVETGAIYKKHCDCVYFLKNVHAAIASNMMAMTHKDESLIPVFLAMRNILSQECIFVSRISTGRNWWVMVGSGYFFTLSRSQSYSVLGIEHSLYPEINKRRALVWPGKVLRCRSRLDRIQFPAKHEPKLANPYK